MTTVKPFNYISQVFYLLSEFSWGVFKSGVTGFKTNKFLFVCLMLPQTWNKPH